MNKGIAKVTLALIFIYAAVPAFGFQKNYCKNVNNPTKLQWINQKIYVSGVTTINPDLTRPGINQAAQNDHDQTRLTYEID